MKQFAVAAVLLLGVGLSGCGSETSCQSQPEFCDNLDNNCNNLVDEGLSRPCNSACGSGTETCINGQWHCSIPLPTEEICNNLDDDCDGLTDEGLNVDADGDGHYNLNSCIQPADDCNDADPTVYPGREEACDNKDNNCNKQIDEGCYCHPPATQACGSTVGECDLGTQTCQADGSWGVCLNSLGQKVLVPGEMDELCDLKDNDCDGQTDEGNPEGGTECGVDQGVCSVGIRVCENGQIQCKNGVLPTQEVCNNLDDDCDGVTDEDVTGDKYETNETCDNPGLLPNVTDNDDPTIITELSIFPKNDKDWFRTTFTESGALDWCVLEPQCYKLNLRMYPPISADPTQWEVCLHLGGADSADCGTFETKNTFCSRYPEDFVEDGQGDFFAFSILFEGKCGLPDNRVGTIVVRSADVQDPIETCEPYRLWLSKEYLGAKECSDF